MFPEELPRRLIRLLTDPGDVVLDCFVGSGTTATAAIKEGRHFIGIDLTEKYVEVAKRKCKKALEVQKLCAYNQPTQENESSGFNEIV